MLTMGVGRAEPPRATRGLRDRQHGVGGSPVSAAEARLEAGDSASLPNQRLFLSTSVAPGHLSEESKTIFN